MITRCICRSRQKSIYLNKETLQEPVQNHFKKSYSDSNIPITTIHQVKGKSLDSVLAEESSLISEDSDLIDVEEVTDDLVTTSEDAASTVNDALAGAIFASAFAL